MTTFMILVLSFLLLAVLAIGYRRERVWDRERADLLQRIQAPERAVAAHAQHKGEPRPPRRRAAVIPLDNDAAMNRAIGGDDGGS